MSMSTSRQQALAARNAEWLEQIRDGVSLPAVARGAGVSKATVWRAIMAITGRHRFGDLRGRYCTHCGGQLAWARSGYCGAESCQQARRRAKTAASAGTCAGCGARMQIRPRPDGEPQWCQQRECQREWQRRRARMAWWLGYQRDYWRWQQNPGGPKPHLRDYRMGLVVARPAGPGGSPPIASRLKDAAMSLRGRVSGLKAAAQLGVSQSTIYRWWTTTDGR